MAHAMTERMATPLRSIVLFLGSAAGIASAAEIDFNQQVRPVLENACVRCHNADKAKGGLRLDTKEGFLKGGNSGPLLSKDPKAEKGELVRRITLPRGHEDLMPQEAEPLSGPHRKWLEEWVQFGAKWPDGIVLKVHRKEIPGLAETNFIPAKAPASLKEAAAAVDTLIAKENGTLKGPKLKTAPVLDDLAFLRRATVDLIARIPTAEEIQQFESDPPATRREKLIDRLLEHKGFSGRWSVFFADMLRVRSNAEGGPELLAYVHQCLANKKPYDEMVRELLSTNGKPDQAPAVGFTLGDAANPMPLAGATSQIFLGVRLQCAECHDHPFDDWKQKEFYELAAFFGQTKRVETGKNIKKIYATETNESSVKWPPEREQPPKREVVAPKFPFELLKFAATPHYIARFEQLRTPDAKVVAKAAQAKDLDNLVDSVDVRKVLKLQTQDAAVLSEASDAAKQKRENERNIYSNSALRLELARFITDPRNPYFSRAFVNRVWAELVGRGFVTPLDNFSAYNDIIHPQTLQYLAQEFIASGYDLRALVKLVMLTQTYQRTPLPAGANAEEVARAETHFTATRSRRMLSEVLLDSITTAGHLSAYKWPEGANRREVKRQVRVPLAPPTMIAEAKDETGPGKAQMMAGATMMGAMMSGAPQTAPAAPYDSEKGTTLDFDSLLSQGSKKKGDEKNADLLNESKKDIEAKKKMEEDAEEAARLARIRLLNSGNAERFRLETITQTIDDNPKFDSTLRMASPAPPSHFLRVFGQPARDNLGEFRDELPSLRQELMMLNGKATHEAARVGPLEPVFKLVDGKAPKVDKAVELVYLESLTRRPSSQEMKEAKEIVASGSNAVEGISDLRWALLNSHEFRYLP